MSTAFSSPQAPRLLYTAAMPKAESVRWNPEHSLIALNLFGKLLFRFDKGTR